MNTDRRSGILLHITSLPGTPGIGTMGKPAYDFVDWLEKGGQTLWQVLPLGPTGYGDSPYASFSTFAGNPLLIDIEKLRENGWLSAGDCNPPDSIKTEGYVDFGAVIQWKNPLLRKAASKFLESASASEKKGFEDFKKKQAYWLDNYTAFMSIKDFYDKKAAEEHPENSVWFAYWPKDLASKEPAGVKKWVETHKQEIEIYSVLQYFFFSQWKALKDYANGKGISIIGDIPIFVAADSADVWGNQEFFQLGKDGKPSAQAGVPPDYFCKDGQLWGNPLYDWKKMKKNGYAWWITRIKSMLEKVDFIRIDHFRGFESYWAVPSGEKTAVNGKWEKGPSFDFFNEVKRQLGELPFLAEDLGFVTKEVQELRDGCGFPGMKVLQFAFNKNEAGKEGFTNAFLPHMYPQNCLVCTGTHDNDTMQGWLDSASKEDIQMILEYFDVDASTPLTPLIVRAGFMSVACYAVFPLQDIYALGKEARINEPSTVGKNWAWRMGKEHMDPAQAERLRKLSVYSGRNGQK